MCRTATPPCSSITSGTTWEQIRLYKMVEPGDFSSSDAATRAVVSDPETVAACSSTRKTRSASPSKASPMSAPRASTAAFRSARFAGWMGSAGWLGNAAVELGVEDVDLEGEAGEDERHDEPAHAVGRVGHHLQRPERGDVDERVDVGDVVIEQVDAASSGPGVAGAGGSGQVARP